MFAHMIAGFTGPDDVLWTDSLRILAPEGRLLVLGFSAGEIPVVKAIFNLLAQL
jgi:ubiquinone/menaquinone biosynthesis C-methylase UbiE